jgi:low affinity Fe/Cu permease
MRPTKSTGGFSRFAKATAKFTGRPASFALAVVIVAIWGLTGPLFHYSDTWQLVINTGTTIVTFLMVFLIQNMQNRDSEATQVKLDELIRSIKGAHLALLNLEELEERELDRIKAGYIKLAEKARSDLRHGRSDTYVCEVDGHPRQWAKSRARQTQAAFKNAVPAGEDEQL